MALHPALAASPDLQDGDLRVSLDRHRAWRGEQELRLPPIMWRLLVWFMQHPDHSASREELYAEVWAGEPFGSLRTVDVHIRRLRADIGPGRITTLRDFGYRWERV